MTFHSFLYYKERSFLLPSLADSCPAVSLTVSLCPLLLPCTSLVTFLLFLSFKTALIRVTKALPINNPVMSNLSICSFCCLCFWYYFGTKKPSGSQRVMPMFSFKNFIVLVLIFRYCAKAFVKAGIL